jgi:hypothetical protein
MNLYWEIILTTGDSKLVPPKYAEQIKKDIRSGQTHLSTYEPLLIRSILHFRETDKQYVDQSHQLGSGVTEEIQASSQPIITEYGVKAMAIKKQVPTSKREYHSKMGHTILSEDDGRITVGFIIPAHRFDPSYMERVTKEEYNRIKH